MDCMWSGPCKVRVQKKTPLMQQESHTPIRDCSSVSSDQDHTMSSGAAAAQSPARNVGLTSRVNTQRAESEQNALFRHNSVQKLKVPGSAKNFLRQIVSTDPCAVSIDVASPTFDSPTRRTTTVPDSYPEQSMRAEDMLPEIFSVEEDSRINEGVRQRHINIPLFESKHFGRQMMNFKADSSSKYRVTPRTISFSSSLLNRLSTPCSLPDSAGEYSTGFDMNDITALAIRK
ncbi:hypothetical protein M427DRAFT_236800 [Gonapodya prolifera JEL478]|uniref:Uncharacterized protein n=1 Tax=Gonapodya prolifera (strain JEL478) TaxID=1344416 RepID=A0A139AMJ2_GONPJ|nr:hypothetical protein M427DRAFT_236800 [Gonapodya prolifera JEL478]|eukprot:KXS17987.1 hypothetical protein M427DRAFT_236800 [Gonapodya prolifera JEL478]